MLNTRRSIEEKYLHSDGCDRLMLIMVSVGSRGSRMSEMGDSVQGSAKRSRRVFVGRTVGMSSSAEDCAFVDMI